jgi:hypothetical protein
MVKIWGSGALAWDGGGACLEEQQHLAETAATHGKKNSFSSNHGERKKKRGPERTCGGGEDRYVGEGHPILGVREQLLLDTCLMQEPEDDTFRSSGGTRAFSFIYNNQTPSSTLIFGEHILPFFLQQAYVQKREIRKIKRARHTPLTISFRVHVLMIFNVTSYITIISHFLR